MPARVGGAIAHSLSLAGRLSVILALSVTSAAAQRAELHGVVSDASTGTRLPNAFVVILVGNDTVGVTMTDINGRFQATGRGSGVHSLLVRRIGYLPRRVPDITPGNATADIDVRLVQAPSSLDPILVTATLRPETKFDAPVSASVVSREAIQAAPTVTALDHIRNVPGIDFAAKGIATNTFSARGPRGISASSMLMMSDYRYAALPYLGINSGQLLPSTDDDIERIEVVRGPGAVIYGPNSRRGTIHIIKRSPLEDAESMASLAAGSRSYGDVAFRVSQPFRDHTLGVKVSGRYYSATDWAYTDPVEDRLRTQAIAAGANPSSLLLGKRHPETKSIQGDLRVDWKPDRNTLIATTAGINQATGIETGGEAGAAQAVDWMYGYAQTRIERGALFGNFTYNWGDAGGSYNLRNGVPVTTASRLASAQLQHGVRIGRSSLQYGADLQWTDPRTATTLNGRFENDDRVVESGAYGYLTSALSPKVDLVAALRVDHHSRLEDPWFLSPRAGIVVKPSSTQSVRLMYSRSFEQPAARLMFADFSLGPLGPLPYNIQLYGLGGSASTVNRNCGGICMRVPGAFGGGAAPQPAVAATMWPVIVGVMKAQGVDISGIPAPTAAQAGTQFGALNFTTGGFDAVSAADIVDAPPIRRSEEQTLELGYKAFAAQRLSLGADLYYTKASRVFASGAAVLTPNVFFDAASLTKYLAGFMPAANAGALAAGIAQIPVGTVATAQSSNSDILVAPFGNQGGAFSYVGLDLFADAEITPRLTASASYSWVDRDSASLGVHNAFLLFNIPRNKGALSLAYRDDARGLTVGVRGRALSSFSVNTPAYIGVVAGYTSFDATVGAAIPGTTRARLLLDVSNVLDHRHQEMIGSAELGRFIIVRLNVRR